MSALQQAEPKRAFSLGFLLILLMPTGIVAVTSTAHWLHDNHDDVLHAWPLVGRRHATDGPADPRLPAPRSAPRNAMPGGDIIVIVYFIYRLVK